MTTIDKPTLIKILAAVSAIMVENRDLLCKLDAEMGDGDLGLTMSKAFPAAEQEARENEEPDLGRLLMKCGMKMNTAAPSTMGTLMASGFMHAGKHLAGRETLDTADFAKFYQLVAEGAANRGKASRGERTVLDSLYPAADAAEQAATAGADIPAIAKAALTGAEAGLEATKDMLPQYGKAAVFIATAKGKIDQGALVGKLFAEGVFSAVAAG
ncbi:MAG: dihydroxyacetone kinase subunit L [Oscillospiraceae bacterium]|nr:dihydroxyacetone kinase subunit L [Oscillospiraceae bacterium]